jgi:1,4-dihydroxy-2-naphthoyl-CoA hydrolase
MGIWFRDFTLEELNAMNRGNLGEHLGIAFTGIGDDCLTATMPVEGRTKQPAGLLHGGASVALAEHLGSVAANLCVDPDRAYCVGQEINANHLRAVRSGVVTGVARPVHLGRSSQVWEIRISAGEGELVCISRLTMAVVERR